MGVYGVEIRLLARLWLALNPDNGRIHVIHFVEQLLNEKNKDQHFLVCLKSENGFLCSWYVVFCLFSFCVFSDCLSLFNQRIFLLFFFIHMES